MPLQRAVRHVAVIDISSIEGEFRFSDPGRLWHAEAKFVSEMTVTRETGHVRRKLMI